jgi:hypothetical protein
MPESEPQQPAQITERVIATFDDYPGMLAAMRLRAEEQRIPVGNPAVDEVAGIPDHYLAKLLSPKTPRRLGMVSMAGVLGVLGVKLVMVESRQAMERYGSRIPKRKETCVHAGTVHIALSGKHMRAIRRKGGANSRKNLGKRLRRALAQQGRASALGEGAKGGVNGERHRMHREVSDRRPNQSRARSPTKP